MPPALVLVGALVWLSVAAFGSYVAVNRSELSRQARQEHGDHQRQQQQRRDAIRRAQIQRARREEDQRRCMKLSKGEQFCCQVGERPDTRERTVFRPRIMVRVTLMCCDARRPVVFRNPLDRSVPDGCRISDEWYR